MLWHQHIKIKYLRNYFGSVLFDTILTAQIILCLRRDNRKVLRRWIIGWSTLYAKD